MCVLQRNHNAFFVVLFISIFLLKPNYRNIIKSIMPKRIHVVQAKNTKYTLNDQGVRTRRRARTLAYTKYNVRGFNAKERNEKAVKKKF